MFIGKITILMKGGSDTAPELFVSGGGQATFSPEPGITYSNERNYDGMKGAAFPRLLVMVNGSRSAATAWAMEDDGPDVDTEGDGTRTRVTIGHKIAAETGWNLSDMYFVNNWPGAPLTQHKSDRNDTTDEFVT
ncbi:hypothetical protein M1197_23870, partial [Salmonella enterica subsp. enterica serovar Sandiego]|uniref:hypothetical protein n=1 Tax=Salmonella enterica TaxID=28901 RepID=UPI0021B22C80